MNTIHRIALSTACAGTLLAGASAHAGYLTGKTLAAGGAPQLTPSSAVVGAGVEFEYSVLGPNDGMRFDFDEDGLLRIYLERPLGGSHGFSGTFDITWTDSLGQIADIVGFSIVNVDAGITGVAAGDLSFTTDTFTFSIGDTNWPGGSQAPVATFQLSFRDQAVPEPASGALLGLALAAALGAGSRRRIVGR